MISLRYHIVSIVAVFLAIGVGVVLGSTVIDSVLVDQLRQNVEDARDARDTARDQADRANQRIQTRDRQITELGASILRGRLAARPVIFVTSGQETDWHTWVRDAVTSAGGEPAGTIALTDRWDEEEAGEELTSILQDVAPGVDEPGEAGITVLEAAGRLHQIELGRDLIDSLADDGYLRIDGRSTDVAWPPSVAAFVVFDSDTSATGRMVALAGGLATVAPTVVVTGADPEDTAVAELRALAEAPATLSTFDGAGDDPSGVGSVLALDAAIAREGGHFGLHPDRRYIPEPV